MIPLLPTISIMFLGSLQFRQLPRCCTRPCLVLRRETRNIMLCTESLGCTASNILSFTSITSRYAEIVLSLQARTRMLYHSQCSGAEVWIVHRVAGLNADKNSDLLFRKPMRRNLPLYGPWNQNVGSLCFFTTDYHKHDFCRFLM